MSTAIYYFSATGNSLTTARILAEKLGECRLVNVALLRDKVSIIEDADTVGFVFPVYYGNMPWPMRDAIAKMVFNKDAYIFNCATYGGHAGAVAKRLDQLLKTRGVKLSLACGVAMPGNSFINAPEVDAGHLAAQRDNIEKLLPAIIAREVQDYSEAGIIGQTPIDYANNFRAIMADENCVGCGTCVKVCPMGNIKLVDGKAVIGEGCSTCLACFHWCPKEAIWMSKQPGIERRAKYHHPDVTVNDFFCR